MALSETKIDLQNVQSFVVTGKDIRRWDIDKTRCLSCQTSKNCCCGSVLLNKVSSLWRHITLSVFPVWYRKFTSLMYRDGKLSVWCTSYCIYRLTLFPLVATFVVCWWPLETVWTQIRPDKMSGLIWIQTVWHFDGIPEKVNFQTKYTDDKKA